MTKILESDRNFKAPIVIMFKDITLAINEKIEHFSGTEK